ncbi:Ribosomal large subunit pseudouridine synthase C [Vibrio stylophorae]|uniref:Ribosomal large subunit pseudouridine synthase C n=1 Tax=Vibrio stylophorae TaxID=659351 RepID=A0ABM8ZSN5_9VIBR|nr:TIGR01621 family pseudouridine synthase [Vibrio stylophorae]CAH0533277.1 Ribosomal large subunit pseudouridine synthase C [Vibrio stylophorae]
MFDILFSHPDFVVIHKAAGVSVHRDNDDQGLLDVVSKEVGVPLYLIHRLDKMTSGLLLLGKNAQAAAALSELFAKRQVEKFYIALSEQKPKKKQGKIQGDMSKARRGSYKLEKTHENPAITQFLSFSLKPGMRAFICKPYTGKTHQIRVALKSVGAPILGDIRYGGAPSDRGYLHAAMLRFTYQGELFRFFQIPKDGAHWCDELGQDWILQHQAPELLAWPKLF